MTKDDDDDLEGVPQVAPVPPSEVHGMNFGDDDDDLVEVPRVPPS